MRKKIYRKISLGCSIFPLSLFNIIIRAFLSCQSGSFVQSRADVWLDRFPSSLHIHSTNDKLPLGIHDCLHLYEIDIHIHTHNTIQSVFTKTHNLYTFLLIYMVKYISLMSLLYIVVFFCFHFEDLIQNVYFFSVPVEYIFIFFAGEGSQLKYLKYVFFFHC